MNHHTLQSIANVGTLLCLVLCIFAGVAAWQAWRMDRRDAQVAKQNEQSTSEGIDNK